MKAILRYLLAGLLLVALLGCAHSSSSSKQTMKVAIQRYYYYAENRLSPSFKQAGVHYPPRAITLLAFKDSKTMQLYARDQDAWHYIKSFPILAASGGAGPKLHRNDRQVPEGIYRVIGMNPNSRFDLSLELNYPNRFDRKHAKLDGRQNLGDDIFIHGSHYSAGCLAMGDDAIQQLFELVYWVGKEQVTVIIAPTDLRDSKPTNPVVQLAWLPELYSQTKQALKPFH